MTAKHRKGKGNHKNEDNFLKNEVVETEVRAGANNYALMLVLFLLMVIGGATGAWFCFQQNQTLTSLTDNLTGMQMKMVRLQSAHEEMRQSSNKQHISENMESRLTALEESYALAQKQVGMALATAEQLRTSDLPAQVLSLHTEMKSRLAEMQQATVSLEQLSQLQTMLKGKSEEFDGVRVQVEGLVTLSADLFHQVEVLTGSLAEAESRLEDRVGDVSTLSASLDAHAAEVLLLKEQLDAHRAQLEAGALEAAAVRELLESEQSQRLQQASVEEQLDALRHGLQDQTAAARSLTSGLEAQLEDIQKQVTQLVGESQPPAEPEEQTEEEEAAPAAEEEEEAEPAAEEEAVAEAEEEAAPSAEEEAVAEAEEEAEPAAEEEAIPADVEKEASNQEEELEVEEESEGEAAAQDEAHAMEDSVSDETAPAEEVEAVKEDESGEEEEVPEEEASEGEKVQEESALEEEEISEGADEQQDVEGEEEEQPEEGGEEPLESDALTEDECKVPGLSSTASTQEQGNSVSLNPVCSTTNTVGRRY